MATEPKNTRNKEPVAVKLSSLSNVTARAQEIHELIARRAYATYGGRGHADGHDKEDWAKAESEVLASLFVGFMELNGDLCIDLGIAMCELPQLQVAVEPSRLIVSGKRKLPDREAAQGYLDEKPVPSEIFQVVDFPVQVEPSQATAIFWNGLLELRIPKARRGGQSAAAKAA